MWPCRNGFFSPPRLKHSLSEKLWKYNERFKNLTAEMACPSEAFNELQTPQTAQMLMPKPPVCMKTAQFRQQITRGKIKSNYTNQTCAKSLSTTLDLKLVVSKVWFVLFLEDTVLTMFAQWHDITLQLNPNNRIKGIRKLVHIATISLISLYQNYKYTTLLLYCYSCIFILYYTVCSIVVFFLHLHILHILHTLKWL